MMKRRSGKNRWFDRVPLTVVDLMSWMVGFCVACAVGVGLMMWVTLSAVQERNQAQISERQAWDQVNTLRATVAILRSGQGMEEF